MTAQTTVSMLAGSYSSVQLILSVFLVSVKRRSWSWQQFLNQQQAEAAPVALFTQVK